MKKFEKIGALLIALILLACIGGCFVYPYYQWWQFDRLEQHARKMITASELQAWATNLLAKYPAYSALQRYEMRTNYPPQLRSLCPSIGPLVSIFEVNSNNAGEDWTKYPTFVKLYWGGTPIGHGGFEIGPTNFVSYLHPNAHAWAPGVYFYREKD
jgi:hypothetical protein